MRVFRSNMDSLQLFFLLWTVARLPATAVQHSNTRGKCYFYKSHNLNAWLFPATGYFLHFSVATFTQIQDHTPLSVSSVCVWFHYVRSSTKLDYTDSFYKVNVWAANYVKQSRHILIVSVTLWSFISAWWGHNVQTVVTQWSHFKLKICSCMYYTMYYQD